MINFIENFKFRRNSSVLICFALTLALFQNVQAKQVQCERAGDLYWSYDFIGTAKTCFMQGTTVINEIGSTFSTTPDASMVGLNFEGNKNIEYLPENIAETFPNLLGYDAWKCSIKIIFKAMFKNMNKLKVLSLQNNQIERISSDTFEDLVSLKYLWLRK
jgi:Leucine rich repeat